MKAPPDSDGWKQNEKILSRKSLSNRKERQIFITLHVKNMAIRDTFREFLRGTTKRTVKAS